MNIKYYVRTTGDRKFDYSPLKYEVLVDTERSSMRHFFKCLELIQDEDAVILEDDLELCDNFQEEIEKAIAEHPDYIINFFSRYRDFYTSHLSDRFNSNQCTYYPKGSTIPIVEKYKEKYSNGEHRRYYSNYLDGILRRLGIPNYCYRPTLVQHKEIDSLLSPGKIYKEQTLYYKKYIDELGIKYEDALKPENEEKLKQLLERDNEKWKGEL